MRGFLVAVVGSLCVSISSCTRAPAFVLTPPAPARTDAAHGIDEAVPQQIDVEGLGPLPAARLVVSALPRVFARKGEGAILGPSAIPKGNEAIVIDLREREMFRSTIEEAPDLPPRDGAISARVCRHRRPSGAEARWLLADVSIDGVPSPCLPVGRADIASRLETAAKRSSCPT